VIEFLAFMAALLIALAVMGVLGDSIDRRDARRRNHVRRLR
jgi:hypothetical protein